MDIPTKDRLYEALVARNMKAIDLSKATGLSRGAISQWLSGKANPKQDKIYIMSKALNVSAAWLMGKDVPMNESITSNNISIGTNNGAVSGSGNATVVNNTSAEQSELLSFLAKKFDIPELKQIKIDFATGSILAGGRKISDLTNPTIALCLQALSQELSRAAKEHNNKIDFVIE